MLSLGCTIIKTEEGTEEGERDRERVSHTIEVGRSSLGGWGEMGEE